MRRFWKVLGEQSSQESRKLQENIPRICRSHACPSQEDRSQDYRREGPPHADVGGQAAVIARRRVSCSACGGVGRIAIRPYSGCGTGRGTGTPRKASLSPCRPRTPLTLTLSLKGRGDQDQVPISQEARYFSCSLVRRSISTPMAASLRRAISLSMTAGTE